jgi:hypothetical protein
LIGTNRPSPLVSQRRVMYRHANLRQAVDLIGRGFKFLSVGDFAASAASAK